MGPPYYAESHPDSMSNFYESYDLSWHLRNWWNEPTLVARVATERRIRFLELWVQLQESVGFRVVGAKHPLLSLCVEDLVVAWGSSARFIWSYRPFDESVAGLKRRRWFEGQEHRVQSRLWESLVANESSTPGMVRMDWNHVREDPLSAAKELAALSSLQPSAAQLEKAASFVRKLEAPPAEPPPEEPTSPD